MKKIYIAPKIDVIILDTLCDATLQTCSVFKGEEQTKTGTDYKGLWGESNSANWGDD